MSPTDTPPPRGWYPDPADPRRERYWDGQNWTQVVRHAPTLAPRPGNQTVIEPAPAPRPDPAQDLPLARWWLRLASGLIDYVFSTVLTGIVLLVFARSFAGHLWSLYWQYAQQIEQVLQAGSFAVPGPSDAYTAAVQTLTLLGGGVMVVYTVIFLGTWGATLGQRLVGIRVIKAPLPPNLQLPNARPAFTVQRCGWLRAISKGASWVLFSTGGGFLLLLQVVNVLLPLWHKRKQSLTDLFANTLTIQGRVRDEETPPSAV